MPESPEVKHFAKDLSKFCSGETLQKLEILRGPYSTNSKKKYSNFREKAEAFQPHKVTSVKSKGKWLYFRLKGPQYYALGVHHGMEGSWCKNPENKHIILGFEFSDKNIYFQDSRRFGTFSLLTKKELTSALDRLGHDVFSVKSKDFTEAFQTKRIQSHQLCDVLLDQRVVSGIGNYLRADIMYEAGINPRTLIKELSKDQILDLHSCSLKIVHKSFQDKATTCGNYSSSIHTGHYDPLIYGKRVCPLGYPVETFKSKGRTVHWVKMKCIPALKVE